MQKIIRILAGQGAPNAGAVFNALVEAGLVTEEATAQNTAALLIAVSAPAFVDLQAYVMDRLDATTEDGDTFGDALQSVFEMDPEKPAVASITIVHHTPWTRISGFESGQCFEFCGPEHNPKGIRTETVISGGTISALCMKLNGPATVSGWSENPVEVEE